ncbi:hypothetical protein [Nitrosomonas sp.]|uniref:hypothetical protein n=1 Tax=Nitrosomonas sp. TaxID=42353 RepID=UPI00272FD945|nr:hypothetical protein [Nitrosomonas sp.]
MPTIFKNLTINPISRMRSNPSRTVLSILTGLYLLNPLILIAGELHQHIEVKVVEERVQTNFCNPEKGCSLVKPETLGLPAGQMPIDQLTGTPIYVSEFIIFPDRTAIDSPGFESIAGDMTAGDRVRYRASGHLSYWSSDKHQWSLAPEGVQIRLAGGLDLQPNQDCGQVFCIPITVEGYTIFSRHGVSSASSLIVGEVRSDGSLHTHLDWIVESNLGTPNAPIGAYMVELQLITDSYPEPSDSLWIMFNNGLPLQDFQQAVAGRVLQSNTDTTLADKLFGWAESNYPTLFPHAETSFIALGYYARCYQNGACVGVKDNHIFAVGGEFGANILTLGEFNAFAAQAGL